MNKFLDKKTLSTLIIIIFCIAIVALAFEFFWPINKNDIDKNYAVSDDNDNTVKVPTQDELLDNLLKDNINLNNNGSTTQEFIGTILEETSKYIIVKPKEDEQEYKVADKIIVTFVEEHLENIYGIGTKVLIVYDGMIAESYPAQINELSISIID